MKNIQFILAQLNLSTLAQATDVFQSESTCPFGQGKDRNCCQNVTAINCGAYLPLQYYERKTTGQGAQESFQCSLHANQGCKVQADMIVEEKLPTIKFHGAERDW